MASSVIVGLTLSFIHTVNVCSAAHHHHLTLSRMLSTQICISTIHIILIMLLFVRLLYNNDGDGHLETVAIFHSFYCLVKMTGHRTSFRYVPKHKLPRYGAAFNGERANTYMYVPRYIHVDHQQLDSVCSNKAHLTRHIYLADAHISTACIH